MGLNYDRLIQDFVKKMFFNHEWVIQNSVGKGVSEVMERTTVMIEQRNYQVGLQQEDLVQLQFWTSFCFRLV
jgi:hypothetical protein